MVTCKKSWLRVEGSRSRPRGVVSVCRPWQLGLPEERGYGWRSTNMGKPPNHPFVHRVFHSKPSILVVFPLFLVQHPYCKKGSVNRIVEGLLFFSEAYLLLSDVSGELASASVWRVALPYEAFECLSSFLFFLSTWTTFTLDLRVFPFSHWTFWFFPCLNPNSKMVTCLAKGDECIELPSPDSVLWSCHHSVRAALLNEGIGHQLLPVQKRMRAVRWLEAPLHRLDMLANAERPPHSMIRQLVQPHVLFQSFSLETRRRGVCKFATPLHPADKYAYKRKDKAFPSWNLGIFYYVWIDYLLNPAGNKKIQMVVEVADPSTWWLHRSLVYTLPETNELHLKMDGWNTIRLPFGAFRPIFKGELLVSGRV